MKRYSFSLSRSIDTRNEIHFFNLLLSSSYYRPHGPYTECVAHHRYYLYYGIKFYVWARTHCIDLGLASSSAFAAQIFPRITLLNQEPCPVQDTWTWFMRLHTLNRLLALTLHSDSFHDDHQESKMEAFVSFHLLWWWLLLLAAQAQDYCVHAHEKCSFSEHRK